MKMNVTIGVGEVKEAIRDYLLKQGFSKVDNIHLKASQDYDRFDRPLGIVFQNATAEVER